MSLDTVHCSDQQICDIAFPIHPPGFRGHCNLQALELQKGDADHGCRSLECPVQCREWQPVYKGEPKISRVIRGQIM